MRRLRTAYLRELIRSNLRQPLRLVFAIAALVGTLAAVGAAEAGLRLAEPRGRYYDLSLLSSFAANYQPWAVESPRQAALDSQVIDEAARDAVLREAMPQAVGDLVPVELSPLPQADVGEVGITISLTPTRTPGASPIRGTAGGAQEMADTATATATPTIPVTPFRPAINTATPSASGTATPPTPIALLDRPATDTATPLRSTPIPTQSATSPPTPTSTAIAQPSQTQAPTQGATTTGLPASTAIPPSNTPFPTATSKADPAPDETAFPTPITTPLEPPSATATASSTPTATFTATPSATASSTATFTATPSATASSTPTATFTATPSATASSTPTATFTATPSATATASSTPTLTIEPTTTATPTASSTQLYVAITVPANNAVLGAGEAPAIEAIAYDPDLGTTNGQGISQVTFTIADASGTELYSLVEIGPAYCAFGGDSSCAVYPDTLWSALLPGHYTITAFAESSTGKPGVTTSITFTRIP